MARQDTMLANAPANKAEAVASAVVKRKIATTVDRSVTSLVIAPNHPQEVVAEAVADVEVVAEATETTTDSHQAHASTAVRKVISLVNAPTANRRTVAASAEVVAVVNLAPVTDVERKVTSLLIAPSPIPETRKRMKRSELTSSLLSSSMT